MLAQFIPEFMKCVLTLYPSISIKFGGFLFYWNIKYQLLNMLKIKRDINQQAFKITDLHFVKSE